MLQQTQVGAVIPYYETWLKRFPDFQTLAAASEMEVLHAWQGLGYYSRARHLHATARQITSQHGGRCPETFEELISLPGIGRYTANAILTFAFDRPTAVVEANIVRLIARLFDIVLPVDSAAGSAAIWEKAGALVPNQRAGEFNSALMDLGALICITRTPRCGACPVRPHCQARDPATLPVKKPRPAIKRLREKHVFTTMRGKILLQQCRERWRGMWMLPRMDAAKGERPLHISTFPFTHHRVRLEIFARDRFTLDRTAHRWFPMRSIESIPMPSPHRRAVTELLTNRAVPFG